MKEVQDHRHLSVRNLSAMLHRSLGYVSERLSLLDYTEIEEAVATQKVTRSAAAEIARETDHAARRELLRMAQDHHLGRQEIQRLRRESRGMVAPTPSHERTLRDVADDLGATEDDVAEAARARQEEPELSPAEALTLAMMRSQVVAAVGDATPAPILPSFERDEQLDTLIQDAGGADVLIRFLEWIEESRVAHDALLDYLRRSRNYSA
jgi:hypothetical protein